MKAFFVPLLLICASATLHAQVDWTIAHKPAGLGPSEVFAEPAANRIHVLTSGVDVNFNGIFEPEGGDISAGWYVLDPAGNAVDSAFFNGFFNSFPIRVGVDPDERIMYAPVNGVVGSFSLETLEPIDEELIESPFVAVSFDSVSGILILSQRASDFSSPGEVLYVDPGSKSLLAHIDAGVNPGNGIVLPRADIGGMDFYSINEGGFGTPNASLTYTSFARDLFGAVNGEPLGGGGSDMVIEGDRAFVLMAGTHQVRVMDVRTHEEIAPSPIEVGTEGFDGPRVLAVSGDTLFVGTYASDVRRFDLKTGDMIDAIAMPGKVEGLAIRESQLLAAISYTAGTYDPDSLLIVVDRITGEPIDTIVVGGQPAGVFVNRAFGYVLVVGYGSGDNPTPWWSRLGGTSLTLIEGNTLPFSLSFPLRAALDHGMNRLVAVSSDTLFLLDISGSSAEPEFVYTDSMASGDLFGVSDGGDYWLVTERPLDFAASPCYLHAVRKSDGKRAGKFLTGGNYVLSAATVPSKAPGGTAAYILHEGNFGGNDATLAFGEYAPALFEGELGSGANHIMHGVDQHGSDVTAVVMTGSHEVLLLDFTEQGLLDISLRIPTGTTGLDGPRQSVIAPSAATELGNSLLVTTYSGEVLLLGGGAVQGRQAIGGKGEGIAALGDRAYTANSFVTGTYDPGTTASVIAFASSSVDGTSASAGTRLEQNYPNPANERTTIPFTLGRSEQVSLDLYSANGELIASLLDKHLEAGRHEATIGTHDLPSGSYIYRLKAGAETFTQRMEVVR